MTLAGALAVAVGSPSLSSASSQLQDPPPVPHGTYSKHGHAKRDPYCAVSGVSRLSAFPHPSGDAPAHLRRHPARGWLLYVPGWNSRSCLATRTEIGAGQADRLARDIDVAKVVSTGTYACPFEDGRQVQVELDYAQAPRRIALRIALNGCAWITRPGARARWDGRAVMADLAADVPSLRIDQNPDV